MKKILLIDDDEDLVDLVKYILELKGFEVNIHPTGLRVADVVRRCNPNLILLDIRLYGTSGIEICKQLKRRHNIPILLFSADKRQGDAYADCDADGFLSKPFSIDELMNTIGLHLKTSEADA